MAGSISHSQDHQNDPASSPEHAVYTPTVEESAIYFQAALRRAIQKARRGDPWEFIALQWPGLELGEREIVGGYFQTMLRLDDSQVDIVRHVFAPDHTELFVKGCTKYGKGYSAALVVNVWFDVFPESKIILTGPDYNHVRNNLFAEVVSLRKQMVAPGGKRVELAGLSEDEALEALGIRGAGGEGSGGGFGSGAMIGHPQQSKDIQSDRIVDKENTKHYIVIANPKTGEGFSGQHSSHTMFVFDEACHDSMTEVMSRRGWIRFADIREDDELLTMDVVTKAAYFEKPLAVTQSYRCGEMRSVSGRSLDMLVTPNHRMLSYDKNGAPKIAEIQQWDSTPKYIETSVSLDSADIEWFDIPTVRGMRKTWPGRRVRMDDWLEFLGWYLSEGHLCFVRGRPYVVGITQSDDQARAEIADVCSRIGFNPSVGYKATTPQLLISSGQLASMLLEYGRGCKVKRVPEYVLGCSQRQLRLFLDTYLRGDGHRRPGGRSVIYTSSSAMADGLHAAAILAGYRSSVTVRKISGVKKSWRDGHVGVSSCDSFTVSIMRGRNMRVKPAMHVSSMPYSGMVYCAQMRTSDVLFTRRNGHCAWSGNSVVDKMFYDNAKKQARYILSLSNPRVLSGWFYEGFGKFDPDVTKSVQTTFGRRRLVTADGGATVNVRFKRIEKPFAPPDGITVRGVEYQAGEPIPLDVYEDVAPLIPAQIDYARYYDIMSDPDENNRNVYGRGRFPREDAELQVVLASWVDRAQKAWDAESIEVDSFGFDVATSDHGDTSSLAAGSGAGCREIHVRQGAEATVTAGWLVSKIRESYGIDLKLGRHPVAIDYGGGYGSGVGSLLREMGVWVIPVVPNERSNDPKKYVNKRAEMWGRLGNRLDPKREWGESPPWALPCDPLMAEDMLAQEKIIKSDGISFQLIPKSKTNASYNGKVVKDKLGGRSPDRGDAVALLWWAVSSNLTVDDYAGRSLVLGVAGDDGLASEAERRREVISRLGKAVEAEAEVGAGGKPVSTEAGKPAGVAVPVELSPEERMAVEWDRELSRMCGLMDSQYDEEGRAGF